MVKNLKSVSDMANNLLTKDNVNSMTEKLRNILEATLPPKIDDNPQHHAWSAWITRLMYGSREFLGDMQVLTCIASTNLAYPVVTLIAVPTEYNPSEINEFTQDQIKSIKMMLGNFTPYPAVSPYHLFDWSSTSYGMRIYLRYCENVDDIFEVVRHLDEVEKDPLNLSYLSLLFVLSDVVWDLKLRRLEGPEFDRQYRDAQRPTWKIEAHVARALNDCDENIVELWNRWPSLNFLDQSK